MIIVWRGTLPIIRLVAPILRSIHKFKQRGVCIGSRDCHRKKSKLNVSKELTSLISKDISQTFASVRKKSHSFHRYQVRINGSSTTRHINGFFSITISHGVHFRRFPSNKKSDGNGYYIIKNGHPFTVSKSRDTNIEDLQLN